jgi:hypothetical protein
LGRSRTRRGGGLACIEKTEPGACLERGCAVVGVQAVHACGGFRPLAYIAAFTKHTTPEIAITRGAIRRHAIVGDKTRGGGCRIPAGLHGALDGALHECRDLGVIVRIGTGPIAGRKVLLTDARFGITEPQACIWTFAAASICSTGFVFTVGYAFFFFALTGFCNALEVTAQIRTFLSAPVVSTELVGAVGSAFVNLTLSAFVACDAFFTGATHIATAVVPTVFVLALWCAAGALAGVRVTINAFGAGSAAAAA